jgi:hypothetical protein
MLRSPAWSSVLLTILAAGCSTAGVSSPAEAASVTGSPRGPSAGPSTSAVVRPPLPSGFPVPAGAVAVATPDDDPGLIGLWESDLVGSAAYDFYVGALPSAGYPIVGLYPGGGVALIRFQAPGGGIWQVVSHGSVDGGTTIEVRLDRP